TFEPFPELRVGESVEHADHGHRNRALANKLDLAFEDVVGIVIEADDETGHHFHAMTLYPADGVEQVAAVLRLLRFLETLLHGRLDTQENATKTGSLHRHEQVFIIGE